MRHGLWAALALVGCGDVALPPLAEARLYVDTDLPLELANRLRVDVYSGSRWVESSDLPRLDPSDYPTSFGLHVPSDRPRDLLVRLRVYRGGVVRDYHGERFQPRAALDADPAAIEEVPAPEGEVPRLIAQGVDRTPLTEPEPTVAIDRLVRVRLEPGVVRTIPVVLRGVCAGTMADLAGARTCVARENELESAEAPEGEPLVTSRLGTFGSITPCALEPRAESGLFDEEICVPGRAFLFGGRVVLNTRETSARPERVIVEPPFRVDKYEVSVARYRDALERGFRPTFQPIVNDGPILPEGTAKGCTFYVDPVCESTLTQDRRGTVAIRGGSWSNTVGQPAAGRSPFYGLVASPSIGLRCARAAL